MIDDEYISTDLLIIALEPDNFFEIVKIHIPSFHGNIFFDKNIYFFHLYYINYGKDDTLTK